jgi:hypothetical protein
MSTASALLRMTGMAFGWIAFTSPFGALVRNP